jgi:uncharacterized membrane protein
MMTEYGTRKKLPKKLAKYLPPLNVKNEIERDCEFFISSSTKNYKDSKVSSRIFYQNTKMKKSDTVIKDVEYRDIETNTDFDLQHFETNQLNFKTISNHKFMPDSPVPKRFFGKNYRKNKDYSFKSITPVVPHSFQSNSIKSISPILMMVDFEVGRSKSFEKKGMKSYIKVINHSHTPMGRKIGLRQKYMNKIVIRSVLKSLNNLN